MHAEAHSITDEGRAFREAEQRGTVIIHPTGGWSRLDSADRHPLSLGQCADQVLRSAGTAALMWQFSATRQPSVI